MPEKIIPPPLTRFKNTIWHHWSYLLLRVSFFIPAFFVIGVCVVFNLFGLDALGSANKSLTKTYMNKVILLMASNVENVQSEAPTTVERTCRDFSEGFLSVQPLDKGKILRSSIHRLMDFEHTYSITVFAEVLAEKVTVYRHGSNVSLFIVEWQPKTGPGQRFTVDELQALKGVAWIEPTSTPPIMSIPREDPLVNASLMHLPVEGGCAVRNLGLHTLGPSRVFAAGARSQGLIIVVTTLTTTILPFIQPTKVPGSVAWLADNNSKILLTSSNDSVFDAEKLSFSSASSSSPSSFLLALLSSTPITAKGGITGCGWDRQHCILNQGLNVTGPQNGAATFTVAFNMHELKKYTEKAILPFLSVIIPLSVVFILISVMIGMFSHIPITRVKVALEESGREVVKRYKELNRKNTEKMHQEGAVKFSTEKSHNTASR